MSSWGLVVQSLRVRGTEVSMSGTDDRADKKLPVTGEVGSEGGSYADPTYQVATFEEDLGEHAQAVEPGGVQSDASDVKKYPDEAPD